MSANLGQRKRAAAGAVLAVAVLGAGWLWRRENMSSSATLAHSASVIHLEPFVLNLADSEPRSYLRVGVDLQIAGNMPEDRRGLITARIRDTILGVLTQRDADELLRPDGKARLKQDLVRALQQQVPDLQVEEVYFTEFLIQR